MKDFSLPDRIRKLLALLLCAALLPCAAGCRNGQEETAPTGTGREMPGGSLAVPFTSQDSMNPYFMTTLMNSTLISLAYQSLYGLDAGYESYRELAAGETVSAGSVKVELSPEAVFSDGTPVTGQDVVYSFELAKTSVLFATQLEGVGGCDSAEDGTVVFRLEYPDVNVLNSLTFPIVKRGTATTESSAPVGSGPFCFHQDGIRLTLVCNLMYGGELPPVGTVRLTDVPQDAVLETLVDTGELDFCYSDLSSGNAKRTYSPVSYIYLNNFVFLGMNYESVNLKVREIRKGISCAIDRQEIVKSAFQGFARAATVPFNTSWTALTDSKAAVSQSFYAEEEKAMEYFSALNAGTEETPIDLTLICPDANSFMRNTANLIAKQLSRYYVNVSVSFLGDDEYIAALRDGSFDMYVGEVRIPKNMDLSAFFAYDGSVSYGIDTVNGTTAPVYFRYREGTATAEEFMNAFLQEMPFVPLCFRNGRMCYTPDISYTAGPADGRIFSGISEWKIDTTVSEEG